MEINLISRHRILALGFVAALIGIAPAFAQSQAQQNPTTGCYSGQGFEAEKNEACQNAGAPAAAAEEHAQKPSAKAQEPGCYSGQGFEAEKNEACQTQSRDLSAPQNGMPASSTSQPGHYSGTHSQIEKENMQQHGR